MTRFIIALKELGFKNSEILALLTEHMNEIENMFQGALVGGAVPSLGMLPFTQLFSNRENVETALHKADIILEENKKYGIKTTYYTQATYPHNLKMITNAPAIIYYRGAEFKDISPIAVACVGTRKPTLLSYNAVNYLVPQLVSNKCTIISGLASGVDKLSHQACISAGGKTIAVVANGLDMIYPKENIDLAQNIIHCGGIIMSEYPVGSKPNKYTLVDRNRLIVGMCLSLIIFECDENGGTMYNAEFAERQKKPIFCPEIGGEPTDVQTGTQKLLDENKAYHIQNGRDIKGILKSLGIKTYDPLSALSIIKNYLRSIVAIGIPYSTFYEAYSLLNHQLNTLDQQKSLSDQLCDDAEKDLSFGMQLLRKILVLYLSNNSSQFT